MSCHCNSHFAVVPADSADHIFKNVNIYPHSYYLAKYTLLGIGITDNVLCLIVHLNLLSVLQLCTGSGTMRSALAHNSQVVNKCNSVLISYAVVEAWQN